MHIAEGMLPAPIALAYTGMAAICVARGMKDYLKRSATNDRSKQMVGVLTAAIFVTSLLPIPVPIAGTSSHPAGSPLAAILMGPFPGVMMSMVALLFQALLFGHGGISTLGANTLTLGLLGGGSAYLVFRLGRSLGWGLGWSAGMAGFIGDLVIYLGTAAQLALSLHGQQSFWPFFGGILAAFMPTQLPLAILEGLFTGKVLEYIYQQRREILVSLGVVPGAGGIFPGGVADEG
ncbi:MAG: energy-coupling factor ABC transporter permease [Bacillota bacterium]